MTQDGLVDDTPRIVAIVQVSVGIHEHPCRESRDVPRITNPLVPDGAQCLAQLWHVRPNSHASLPCLLYRPSLADLEAGAADFFRAIQPTTREGIARLGPTAILADFAGLASIWASGNDTLCGSDTCQNRSLCQNRSPTCRPWLGAQAGRAGR